MSKLLRPLREFYFNTPFYGWRLRKFASREINIAINDLWPGEPEVGREIINGKIVGMVASSHKQLWKIMPDDPLSLESLHGFSWLRHLRAQGGEAARLTARQMVGSWLDECEKWHSLYWRGDVLGERISAWIGMYDFFCGSANDEFRSRVLESVHRQLEHGISDFHYIDIGIKRIRAIKGLITALVAFNLSLDRIALLERWLLKELIAQINPDGGHVSRSPAIQIEFVMALIDIRNCFRASNRDIPNELTEKIASMAAMLRLWRHGDGKLALFHGSKEGGVSLFEAVIALSESRRKTVTDAPATGFQRLSAGKSILIVDTGTTEDNGLSSHASPLSFELSIGKQRLVVNCGTSPGDTALKEPLKSSVAHSMLTIDNINASHIAKTTARVPQAITVSFNRETVDGDILLDGSHNGYLPNMGIIHHRSFYLASSGNDIRGEDQLVYTGEPGDLPLKAIIRFHLHPRVRTSLIQRGSSALLRPHSGNVWRFRTDGNLKLEDSIYFGSALRQKSEQLVVNKCLEGIRDEGKIIVKWAFRRED